jgi:hypothetical protein
MDPNIKKLPSGKWGIFVGRILLSVTKTEARAERTKELLMDLFAEEYADGHSEGYDTGLQDGADTE